MMIIHPGCDFIVKRLFPTLSDKGTVKALDIGSGYGYWGFVIKHYLDPGSNVTGIEIDPEYIERMRRTPIYDFIIEEDAHEVLPEYPSDYFNLTIIGSVLEHIEKERGLKILEEIERVTDGLVIIIVPRGDALSMEGHVSIWDETDFESRGYSTLIKRKHTSRVISLFERLWFWIRGVNVVYHVIAWREF